MPLISEAVNLSKRMCDLARKAGHPPKIAIAVGGLVENKWFIDEIFAQLKEDVKIATCKEWPE